MATLTAKVIESITMDSGTIDSTHTLTIASIVDAVKRTVTVDTTEMTLLAFGAHGATDSGLSCTVGTFDVDAVRYIRITNTDGTNHVSLTFRGEGDEEFGVLLDKGQSFMYNGDLATGLVDTMDAHSAAITPGTFLNLLTITALANSAACKLEVFVASVVPSEA